MDPHIRAELIREYCDAPELVAAAVERMSAAELDRRPADGGWSARAIVHHLADAEMESAVRLRRLVAEDAPRILGYDELAWSQRLHYARPVESSLLALRGARASTAEILVLLTEEDWRREGAHDELGPFSMDLWLTRTARHGREHLAQLLAALGTASG